MVCHTKCDRISDVSWLPFLFYNLVGQSNPVQLSTLHNFTLNLPEEDCVTAFILAHVHTPVSHPTKEMTNRQFCNKVEGIILRENPVIVWNRALCETPLQAKFSSVGYEVVICTWISIHLGLAKVCRITCYVALINYTTNDISNFVHISQTQLSIMAFSWELIVLCYHTQ